MMSKEKKIGQTLLYLGLAFMLTTIFNNSNPWYRYIWLAVNASVIIITVVCGVILISGDKEQK